MRCWLSKLGYQNWGWIGRRVRRDAVEIGSGRVGQSRIRPGPEVPWCVGDVRYSLLCVHWAQCKGVLSRAGNARRRSPVAPTWTFTCARIQASGPISATRVWSASRRSPASIYIRGRTQVGDPAGRTGRPPAHASLHSHSASPPNLSVSE